MKRTKGNYSDDCNCPICLEARNDRMKSKAPEMYEALKDCLLKLDIAHNDYNVPCRAEIKELQSLLKEIESNEGN